MEPESPAAPAPAASSPAPSAERITFRIFAAPLDNAMREALRGVMHIKPTEIDTLRPTADFVTALHTLR